MAAFFDSYNAIQRIRVSERFLLPEPDMDRIGEAWGHAGLGVECVGDRAVMRRIVEKKRRDLLSVVAEKLPIWC